MMVRATNKVTGSDTVMQLKAYVTNTLNGDTYGASKDEIALTTADNCIGAIGRLCSVLAEKRVISLPEVVFIATGGTSDVLEAVEK
ncbi:MAG: hypothetical protein GY928_34200 [Colwellia sp.]|nr:hypothetical protein [Colwellia sp.]